VLLYEIYAAAGLVHLRVCHTIHNFRHQGTTGPGILQATGLNRPDYFGAPDRMGDEFDRHSINLMRGAILYSNAVTTVSPHHAWEARHTDLGFGLGHARDVVSERLAAMPAGEVRATLCWYRSHDASGAWVSGSAEAILDACVRALATSAQVTAWAASSQEGTPRQRQAHVTAAGRTWARARLARALRRAKLWR
jgi:hypothetical protein